VLPCVSVPMVQIEGDGSMHAMHVFRDGRVLRPCVAGSERSLRDTLFRYRGMGRWGGKTGDLLRIWRFVAKGLLRHEAHKAEVRQANCFAAVNEVQVISMPCL